jgi:hypothetical protein
MPVRNTLHLARLVRKQASGALWTLTSKGHPGEGDAGPMTIAFMSNFKSNQT